MHIAKRLWRGAVKFPLALMITMTAGPCFGATLPAGFTETVVATLTGSPTAMQFSPDNKLFVTQQNGTMPVWQNGIQLSANFFTNTPLVTDSSSERGLLGIAFDPNYVSNRYVYVYYTILGGDHHNRVSRFTADTAGNLALAASELVIWQGDAHSAGNHNGGAIHFGPDGKLYIAAGDNAQGSTTSQSLTSLHGKILRINADGSIPLDNPFHDSVGPNRDAIWSLGLRNPFTFAFQPGTGRMFVNDVGQNTWEEINDGGALPSGRGLNFGWAGTEGDFNQVSFPAFTRPFFAYHHGSSTTPSGNVITGGTFYNPTTNTYGSAYLGDYFFSDLGNGWIYRIDTATKAVTQFATAAGAVDLKVNNDGSLYYLAYGSQKVFKVTYAGTSSPVITIQPQDQTLGIGSQVILSVDTANGQIFQWQRRDNAGVRWTAIAGATTRNLTFTVAPTDNNALFRVRVANASGLTISDAARLTVQANTAPNNPVITITGGLATSSKFIAGQTISFSGMASDPEDGPLGGGRFSWTINYLTSINQGDQDNDGLPGLTRPFATLNGATSGTFTPATTGPYTLTDVAYALTLVVTDSQGLRSNSRTVISPQTSTITLATNPTGLNLTRDTQPVTAPNSFASVVGFERPIGATPSQTVNGTNYAFTAWSDAGNADHIIVTPASDTTYTASYLVSASTLPAPWANGTVGSVNVAGSASFSAGTFAVNGSGFIRGNADAFQFVYLPANGDCSITARLATLPIGGFSGNKALAGVMIRATLTNDSASVFFGLRPRSTPQMITRSRTGLTASLLNVGTGAPPYWFRLTRVGNTVTAFSSLNGVKWSTKAIHTIPFGSTTYIGLAVCSDSAGLQKATFDNVTGNP